MPVLVYMPPTKIDRIWPDSTVVCIGCGPSLVQADVDHCRDRAKVIAINDAYKLAPWADALYACDSRWWAWHQGAPEFTGLRFGMTTHKWPNVTFVRNLGDRGFASSGDGVYTGRNSGYQSLQLAIIMGAKRVLLLGYDMHFEQGGPTHFFGEHPDRRKPPVKVFLDHFKNCVAPLSKISVEVVNCSPQSALTMFPRSTISEALP